MNHKAVSSKQSAVRVTRGLLLFMKEYSCMAQCEPDKSEGSFADVKGCLFIPPQLNHFVLGEAR